jgi:hypothetical protein
MAKFLRITAKRNGFRRAGIAHSDAPTDHPVSHFKPAQIEQLKDEPMLVVQEVEVESESKSKK